MSEWVCVKILTQTAPTLPLEYLSFAVCLKLRTCSWLPGHWAVERSRKMLMDGVGALRAPENYGWLKKIFSWRAFRRREIWELRENECVCAYVGVCVRKMKSALFFRQRRHSLFGRWKLCSGVVVVWCDRYTFNTYAKTGCEIIATGCEIRLWWHKN